MSQIVDLKIYELKNINTPIEVSVQIGNNQTATSDIYLNGNQFKTKLIDDFAELIGNSDDLRTGQMTISTVIHDVNPNDNKVVFRYKIKGGSRVLNPPSIRLPVEEGGVAHFFTRIFFV